MQLYRWDFTRNIHLEQLQSVAIRAALSVEIPILQFKLKTRNGCCELSLKNTEEDGEESEATASLGAAKEISKDAAAAAAPVLPEERWMALKAFHYVK